MSQIQPQRLQRKRVKGYNMQAESMALNGLPAVSCCRPHKWGNPFKVKDDSPESLLGAYMKFQAIIVNQGKPGVLPYPTVEEIKSELKGKNLACFCEVGKMCHVDILLKIANS